MTFSTEASEMFVSDKTCTTCGSGTLFDSASSSSLAAVAGTTKADLAYGTGGVNGYAVTDDVCLAAAGPCANTFEFFLAFAQEDVYSNAGLVGLAPFVGGTSGQPTLFVKALTSLTAPLFAVSFSGNDAILDLGAVTDATMEDPTDLAYITSAEGKEYWSSSITQVRTRDAENNLSVSYSFEEPIEAKVTIDQNCIGLPESVLN